MEQEMEKEMEQEMEQEMKQEMEQEMEHCVTEMKIPKVWRLVHVQVNDRER